MFYLQLHWRDQWDIILEFKFKSYYIVKNEKRDYKNKQIQCSNDQMIKVNHVWHANFTHFFMLIHGSMTRTPKTERIITLFHNWTECATLIMLFDGIACRANRSKCYLDLLIVLCARKCACASRHNKIPHRVFSQQHEDVKRVKRNLLSNDLICFI